MRTVFMTIAVVAGVGCGQPAAYPAPSPAPATAPLPTSERPAPMAPVPPPSMAAVATLHDLAGARVGSVTFSETYAGVLVAGNIAGLGLGAHAIHVHEFGKCQPPFTSAGGHFNPTGKKHGILSPLGWHLGDLPNIDTPAAGKLRFDLMLPGVRLKGPNGLLDGDGASIVIHASRDNYYTDPTGDSGSRIACGVIVLK